MIINLKYKNGITLIAIVITIIVILIISGASLSLLTGRESIFDNASAAVDEYSRDDQVFDNTIRELENMLAKHLDGSGGDNSAGVAYLESICSGKDANDLAQNNYYDSDIVLIKCESDYDLVEYNGERYCIVYNTEDWSFKEIIPYVPPDTSNMTDLELLQAYFEDHYYSELPEVFDNDDYIPDAETSIIGIRREGNSAGGIIYFKFRGEEGKDYYVNYGRDSRTVYEVE